MFTFYISYGIKKMCTCRVWVYLKSEATVTFKVPFRFTKEPIVHPH